MANLENISTELVDLPRVAPCMLVNISHDLSMSLGSADEAANAQPSSRGLDSCRIRADFRDRSEAREDYPKRYD